jgi:hypothetical protein
LRRYGFTETWLRLSRKKIREGRTNAGPPFIAVPGSRVILCHLPSVEKWCRDNQFGGANGSGEAKSE